MDGNRKTEPQVPQAEGDGKETGEVSEGDGKGKAEVPQADGKKKVQVTEVPQAEECWQPGETENEKKRAREQGPKVDYMLCIV